MKHKTLVALGCVLAVMIVACNDTSDVVVMPMPAREIVDVPMEVTKEVIKTVVVEKEVIQEVPVEVVAVVEKIVEVTVTATPTPTATPPAALMGGGIAFYSDRDGNPEIYVMNADGSDQTRLTNNDAADRRPSWSP